MTDVSRTRFIVMRAFYLLLFLERGYRLVVQLASGKPLGSFDGVAYAFWGALALLCLLGLRYPLRMVPVLLIFLIYKLLWLVMVALPLWSAGTPLDPLMTQFAWAMAAGVVIDLLVIPWGYVIAYYLRAPAEQASVTTKGVL
jgi:hypothetical protein